MTIDQRRAAAASYRPARTQLLLVAEAPPCAHDRYFYFEAVDKHDWLFRYVWEGLSGEKPERANKAACLTTLRNRGVFLVDLHEENISQPSRSALAPMVPGLIERCRMLGPAGIVLIKHSVYDVAYGALAAAGLPVVNERIPFPASGQQKKFLEQFRRAVASTRFRFGA